MKRTCGLIVLCCCVSAAAHADVPRSGEDVIGWPEQQLTRESDTLLDLARHRGLGYVAMRIANPGVDPWLPGAGRLIELPLQHVLPNVRRVGIVINLPELRLYRFVAGQAPVSYAISIGDEGRETPLGSTKVARKAVMPTWFPTLSERTENPELPMRVGPGPDNPMGSRALYLEWNGIAMHGTNQPYSIGRRGSHGCIRLYPQDIEALYASTPIGTAVQVIEQRAKVGWLREQLYLEIHPATGEANAIEARGERVDRVAYDARALVAQAAGSELSRVDWDAVFLAGLEQTGMPLPVLRPLR